MTNWNQIVFVTKLLLVKDSCNMGANNTITTASSSSSGAPRRPTSFLTRNTCFLVQYTLINIIIYTKSYIIYIRTNNNNNTAQVPDENDENGNNSNNNNNNSNESRCW